MPRGSGGRGTSRRDFDYPEDIDLRTFIENKRAEKRADEVLASMDRVVYARMDNIVKSSEFVLDFPDFDEYLSMPFENNRPQAHDEYYYQSQSVRKVSASEFNADGIMGKIQLNEDGCTCDVDYEASLTNREISFSIFRFSVKAFVVKGQRQILVASVDDAKRQRLAHAAWGKPLKIPCADVVEKAKLLGNGATLRVVLNVEIKFCQQRPTTHSIVGISGVNKQSDPPFLKPFQEREDSDVQLICEDEAFPVHGFILKNVSHVFRRMLELPMQEAVTRQILIKDLSVGTVKRMVDYIYHGRINVGSNTQVVNLLYAAEKYEFELLKAACLEGMVSSMSNENVTSFLEISVRVNAGNEVIKQMVAYCMNRIVELRKREDFRGFAQANPKLFL